MVRLYDSIAHPVFSLHRDIDIITESLTGISTLQHGRSIQTVYVPHSTYPRNTRS
jgi:hypothetical protein